MPVTHKNRVQMSVTGTPGTGTITLNAASSGHQSFASAYGADATVDVLITDGTAWEVARNCAYTHSGTTLSRGTLETSSTGSAISLTSAAVVSVIATADRGRQWMAAALEHVAGTDADTTMDVNTMYVVDMSAWATADRNYTLPATAAVGDRVGVMVTAGDASHELILKANTGDTLNGVSAAEWSRLFITGEVVIMRCVTANSAWIVEYDGRIAQKVSVVGSHTHTSTTVYQTASFSGSTTHANIGDGLDAANSRIYVRRGGVYSISVGANTLISTNGKFLICGAQIDGTGGSLTARGVQSGVAGNTGLHMETEHVRTLTAGQYLDVQLRQDDSTSESMTFYIQVTEVL